MKRRNRASFLKSMTRQPLRLLSMGRERKRKSFSFERLEDRLVFSADPVVQTTSYGNDTAAAVEATLLRELQWAALQAVNSDPSAQTFQPMALPNDPLFPYQWHIFNTGQEVGNPDLQHLFGAAGEDLNVLPVWNMLDANGNPIIGTGVLVAVIDSGVQLFHPDLSANISPTLRFNADNGTSNVSPSLFTGDGPHGTAVAGIIGAVANNEIGGSGVAPGVTLVPIKVDGGFNPTQPFQTTVFNALQWAMQNGVDITNNSYSLAGLNDPFGREAISLTPELTQLLRNSVIYGRDGLGMINVFASGNNGGPIFTNEFGVIGNYDSASYSALINSRYTIGVTAVDHDGLYINADGTFTTYPMAGASVLVAAPTGSNGVITVGEDTGYGSGIWTTDLVGEFGYNAPPLPDGFDADADPWADPNYTSRFQGTSAAAPMVSGVIALMLQANPNLTYRDVQEILVRSARQNAQFESPGSGGLSGSLSSQNTWQVNQIQPFRNIQAYGQPLYTFASTEFFDPIADPNVDGGFGFSDFYGPDTGDGGRQFSSHYEPQPGLFTNGAGYTVSQGYGVYSEQIGYGHGVVDAELAVKMALQWHTTGQNMDPGTEKTYTTSIINQGPNTGWAIPAAERGSGPPNGIWTLVPGGIGGGSGFIAYWNEHFADEPFADYDGPSAEGRGLSYIDFAVPPSQAMDVEWVEVRLQLSGPAEDLDGLRIFLTSPDGTQSELNNFYGGNDFGSPISTQPSSRPPAFIDPVGDIDTDGGAFIWTFSTVRHFGESTNSVPLVHPVTGEPILDSSGQPIFRNWELHIENWSNSAFILPITEVIWHGKPIEGSTYDQNYADQGIQSAQRIQGFVGLDTNGDENFNYSRYIQTLNGSHSDVDSIRTQDVQRRLDFTDNNNNSVYDEGDVINQEPFAENVLVQARRVFNGVVESSPVAQFLTGADGNYYFDLNVQADQAYADSIGATLQYQISTVDPEGRALLEDLDTPAQPATDPQFTYLQHFRQSWLISPDWFFAPDRDNDLLLEDNPGEILFDPLTGAPAPYTNNGLVAPVPMAVKNINFLLKQDAPIQQFDVEGTVYTDLNGDGKFNGDDAPAGGIYVYHDVNRNGFNDAGEPRVLTDAAGHYEMTIATDHDDTYSIGVIPPTNEWLPTDPGKDGVENIFAGPGSPTQTVNFFLDPPASANPNGGVGNGTLQGVIYNDLNANGARDAADGGLANFRVYIDSNENGVWDSATEKSTITSSNGSYFFADVTPGFVRIDVVIPNEGTADAAWSMTSPAAGFRTVNLGAGGSITGLNFGVDNRADSDWGDLPDSYGTSAGANGPRHFVVPGFQLGAGIDGEINGIPTVLANGEGISGDDDDGVVIVSNGGVLVKGVNTVRVTVSGVGGLLTGWMDFNADDQFDESERLIWSLNGTNLGGEADLNPGTYDLQVTVPASATDGLMAARFRWGEEGLSFNGAASIGEVEDYRFGLNFLFGDYNKNGTVDNADFVLWRRTQGQLVAPFTGADGNGDGLVNDSDYAIWAANYGKSLAAPAAAALLAEESSPSSLAAGSASVVADPPPASSSSSNGSTAVNTVVVDTLTPPVGGSLANAAFAFVSMPESEFAGFRSMATLTASTVSTQPSNADLLLLDLAWADAGDADYDVADDSFLDAGDEEVHVGNLALAAVLKDESNWWDGI